MAVALNYSNYNKVIPGDIKVGDLKYYGVALVGTRVCNNKMGRYSDVNWNHKMMPVMIDKNNKDNLDNGFISITYELLSETIESYYNYFKMYRDGRKRGYEEVYSKFAYLGIENIYVVCNYAESNKKGGYLGKKFNAIIVCADKIILVSLSSRKDIRTTNTSQFAVERGHACYPACILPRDTNIRDLFNHECYVSPKKGAKFSSSRHTFKVGVYTNTMVINVKTGQTGKFNIDENKKDYENEFTGMQLGKYLHAKKYNKSAYDVNVCDSHHCAAQWDERFIKVIKEEEHYNLHRNKTVHRIHVQLGTKAEMYWFMQFISNVDNDSPYFKLINGLVQINNGFGNVEKSTKVHNEAATSENVMQAKKIKDSTITILSEAQYNRIRQQIKAKYNLPDTYTGC